MKQKCRKCGEEKDILEFYFRSDTGKYRLSCKNCWSNDSKEYRKHNASYISQLKLDWQRNNPDKKRDISKRYLVKNRTKINDYQRIYKRERQSVDARIRANYRARIWKAIKRGDRSDNTIELLGCSIEKFMKYIEKRFTIDMSWHNYGQWHIDHIKPCSSFDLSKRDEQLKCFNYKNLQPLWASDNHFKSNKMDYMEGMTNAV